MWWVGQDAHHTLSVPFTPIIIQYLSNYSMGLLRHSMHKNLQWLKKTVQMFCRARLCWQFLHEFLSINHEKIITRKPFFLAFSWYHFILVIISFHGNISIFVFNTHPDSFFAQVAICTDAHQTYYGDIQILQNIHYMWEQCFENQDHQQPPWITYMFPSWQTVKQLPINMWHFLFFCSPFQVFLYTPDGVGPGDYKAYQSSH